MKNVIFIGNRLNAFKHLGEFSELNLRKVYILEDSLLHKNPPTLAEDVAVKIFSLADKKDIIDDIASQDFDILISNGCPIVLPIQRIKKENQLFINIHPTNLPYLKGKTPLSGVFMTHAKYLGATMHYIDDGIDTGNIIAQEKVEVTDDLDQGLVYKISFDLEGVVFKKGMEILIKKGFNYDGTKQPAGGSYFNRTLELQTINIDQDDTDKIIDKVRSFGIKGQGSYLTVNDVSYRIYAAEKIINDYLISSYPNAQPSKLFEYDDKIVIKTIDGMIKLTDYEVEDDVPHKNARMG